MIVRNTVKQKLLTYLCLNEIHVVWGGAIQDVSARNDLLCNVVLFVGRTVCVAEYQWLYDATIAC